MILRRRSQLMKWLEENAPTASIRRAVGEGSVEFLGWFSKILGSMHPGWIVKVTSTITGIIWYVVIRKARLESTHYAWVYEGMIFWRHWNPKGSENPFMQGDNPEIYRQNRKDATTQGC